jgi:hypothetical protein
MEWGVLDAQGKFLPPPASQWLPVQEMPTGQPGSFPTSGSLLIVPVPDEAAGVHSVLVGVEIPACQYDPLVPGIGSQPLPICIFKGQVSMTVVQ